MRIGCSKVKILILSLVLMLFAIMPAFAQDNIISSVTIAKAKNSTNIYELNIESTQDSNYKINVEDNDNIYFDLKNTVLADDVSTYYEDVNNIDSVIVKQINKNKVRIYIQGKNARNTQLLFTNSILEDTAKENKKITINRPMNEYNATNQDLEDQENIQDWDDNSFNFVEFMSYLRESPIGIVLIFLAIFAVIFGTIMALGKKIAQEKEPIIGLTSNKSVEDTAFEAIYGDKLKENQLPSVAKKSQALQNAQNELAKAHSKYQNYLGNKYNGNIPKKQFSTDSITKGIALNQYQKSTQNPYKNQQVLKMNDRFSMLNSNSNTQNNYQIPPRTQRTSQNMTIQKPSTPFVQKPQRNLEVTTNKKSTNLKFLESVTKIYEESGRMDLADGLKNSITKAKQKI